MATLHLSWGELHFYTCRAVFGAGLPWGLAEDAGFTAAWLARYGIDPAPVLARMLRNLADGSSGSDPLLTRQDDGMVLHGHDDALTSALLTGPSAADWWAVLATDPDARLCLRNVDAPGWVFASIAQRMAYGNPALIRRMMDDPPGDLLIDATRWAATDADADARPKVVAVAAGDWSVVQDFFRRSLVPSTDASRQAGAGAGLIDRD